MRLFCAVFKHCSRDSHWYSFHCSESYKLHSEDGGYESLHSRKLVDTEAVAYTGYESLPRSLSASKPNTGITGLQGFSSRSSSLRGRSKQPLPPPLPPEPQDGSHVLYAKVDRSKKKASSESSETGSPISNSEQHVIRAPSETTKEPLYATIGSNRRPMLPQMVHSTSNKMSDV